MFSRRDPDQDFGSRHELAGTYRDEGPIGTPEGGADSGAARGGRQESDGDHFQRREGITASLA
jgi:hypothetical protein